MLFVVVLAPSLRIMIEQQQQLAQLHDTVAAQKQKVKDLTGSGPGGMTRTTSTPRPGSGSTTSTRASTATSSSTTPRSRPDNGQPISAKIQTTRVDWVSTVLSSVLTAGLTDALPGQIVAPAITGSK